MYSWHADGTFIMSFFEFHSYTDRYVLRYAVENAKKKKLRKELQ